MEQISAAPGTALGWLRTRLTARDDRGVSVILELIALVILVCAVVGAIFGSGIKTAMSGSIKSNAEKVTNIKPDVSAPS